MISYPWHKMATVKQFGGFQYLELRTVQQCTMLIVFSLTLHTRAQSVQHESIFNYTICRLPKFTKQLSTCSENRSSSSVSLVFPSNLLSTLLLTICYCFRVRKYQRYLWSHALYLKIGQSSLIVQ